jgi:hypothetical protein
MDGVPAREAMKELKGHGLFERLDEVFMTGQPYMGKAALFGFKDQIAAFDILCEPWFGVSGQVEFIVIMAVDVTEQILSSHRAIRLARELSWPALLSPQLVRHLA